MEYKFQMQTDDEELHIADNRYDDRDDDEPEWTVDPKFAYNTGAER